MQFVKTSDDCWIWTGGIHKKTGYGNFWLNGTTWLAHRYAYAALVGEIPDGWTVDHLCRVRHCVNPAHLEAVSFAENNRRSDSASARNMRKTHCPQGHPYIEGNIYAKRGRRYCATCHGLRHQP